MNHLPPILFLLFLSTIIINCTPPQEKSFAENAVEEVKDMAQKEEAKVAQVLAEKAFSEEAKQIMQWYDYKNPLLMSYEPLEKLTSNSELDSLLENEDPLKVKALFLSQSNPIDIKKIKHFKNLEYLRIIGFRELPNEFYQLKKLRVFIASHYLKAALTDEILEMKDLEYVSLFCNVQLPNSISQLKKLETLQLAEWNYGQLPFASIYSLSNLKTLWIHFEAPQDIKGISQLTQLKTLVTNVPAPEIGTLQNLKGLIFTNHSAETYPLEYKQLQNLVAFRIQGNLGLRTAPAFVTSLRNLEYLEISSCGNLVRIPEEYNTLSHLQEFKLNYNQNLKLGPQDLKAIKNRISVYNH